MAEVVLVGMGVCEANDRELLLGLATGSAAWIAFLQVGDPSLSRRLTAIADLGAREILLVGASFGKVAPAQSWLRRVAAHWWRERTDPPAVRVAGELLKSPDPERLDELIAGGTRLVTGTEAGLESAAWDDVPQHRHQVFVCRGPRCTARGADSIAEGLDRRVKDAGLSDDDVLITQTGCQFPCNHAPVVTVQPDDTWYGGVDEQAVKDIVAQHLIAGEPVESHRLTRTRSG